MSRSPSGEQSGTEHLDAGGVARMQRAKLGAVLDRILGAESENRFYKEKLAGIRLDAHAVSLETLPLTTRAELERDQLAHPPFGTNLTFPLAEYCRYHQTSGSSGRSMRWLDTRESWQWFKSCWGTILRAAGAGPRERVMFPFSFGPFVGFWAAFDGAAELGCLCLPGGGLSTSARLRMMVDNDATYVCCTPTYALHMAETAKQVGIDLANSTVRGLIVAGEPGGNIPAVRQQIESAWGARVYDHHGMTEIGPVTFECRDNPGGLHVIESEFIAEVIDPQTLRPVPDGEAGELVLTNLGRIGSPLIRYRTGDQVRLKRGQCACGRWFSRLEGGILGRIDDMFIVRGNNVFPPALEAVIRRFPEVAEFRVTVYDQGALAQVKVELEAVGSGQWAVGSDSSVVADLTHRVGRAIQEALHFKAQVALVPPGTLPRFELKSKRFVRVNGPASKEQGNTQ